MPITPQFTIIEVQNFIEEKKEAFLKAVENRFKIAGEMAVAYMRSLNTFRDRTANLRNSEGFIIYRDGQQIVESYPNNATGSEKGAKVGASIGKGMALEIAQQFAPKEGFLLVVTAGMHYALYVEAKGYDVITGGAVKTSKFIKKAMADLAKKVSK